MLWVALLCVGLSAFVQGNSDEIVRYDGYVTLSVGPLRNKQEVNIVHTLVDHDERIRQVIAIEDVITTKAPITLFVSPDRRQDVLATLQQEDIAVEVFDEDLQKQFDRNMHVNAIAKAFYKEQEAKGTAQNVPTYYMRFNEMMTWLTNMANSYSSASRFTVGRSYEGRTVYGISINDNRRDLPAVWLDAGIHAREWIAPATAVYIIDRILTGSDSDAAYLRNNYRFYIAPSVNPDGYEYCFTNNRLWRKTRRPYSGCVGADPNRNFDQFWGRYGTSTSPCSDTYGGPRPFSEVETQNIRDAILARNNNMPILFSLHSYSQLWLLPWAGDLGKPSDYNVLKSVADRAAQAARNVNGRFFQVGTAPDILYAASGGTFDWAKAVAGVKYTYTPELRPASASQGGFDIPASNIVPSGQEIFAGLVQTCRDVAFKTQEQN